MMRILEIILLVLAWTITSVVASSLDVETILTDNGDHTITFRINNFGQKKVWVCAWRVPQESTGNPGEDIFYVMQDGSEVEFKGIRVARQPYDNYPQGYIEVEAGGYLERTVDISNSYRVDTRGSSYEVTYDAIHPPLVCEAGSGGKCVAQLISNTVTVSTVRRKLQEETTKNTLPVSSPFEHRRLEDTFIQCNAGQIAKIQAAKMAAKRSIGEANDALDTLVGESSNAHYECWFGDLNEASLNQVTDKFRGIETDLNQDIRFDCTHNGCAENDWFAYSYDEVQDTVFLCPWFWQDDRFSNSFSRGGVLIHEVSHFPWPNDPPPHGANTVDAVYGVADSKTIANPPTTVEVATGVTVELPEFIREQLKEAARNNADSYRLFAELLPNNAAGGAWGDPHFATWKGEGFDYHGECDLVLLHAPEYGNGVGLEIHVRTKIRYAYSYISHAAIQVGDTVLEVSSFGEYYVDGIAQADLAEITGLHNVTYEQFNEKEHQFVVHLGQGVAIKVHTYKDMVNVKLDGASTDFHAMDWLHTSSGLMGSFLTGEMLARDGKTVLKDPNAYGQEWMVLETEPDLFNVPTHITDGKCILPSVSMDQAPGRRLGEASVSREQAEEVCSHVKGTKGREACIGDVLATNDLEIASKIAYEH